MYHRHVQQKNALNCNSAPGMSNANKICDTSDPFAERFGTCSRAPDKNITRSKEGITCHLPHGEADPKKRISMYANNFNDPVSDDRSPLIRETSMTKDISTSNQRNFSYKTNRSSKEDRSSGVQEQIGKSFPLNPFYRRHSSKLGLDISREGSVQKPSITMNKQTGHLKTDYGLDSRIKPKMSVTDGSLKGDTSPCGKPSEGEKRQTYSYSVRLKVKSQVKMMLDIELKEKKHAVLSDCGIISKDHSIKVVINSSPQVLSSDEEFSPKYSKTEIYPVITEITDDEDNTSSQEISERVKTPILCPVSVTSQPAPPKGLRYLPEEVNCGPIEENETEGLPSISEELPTSSPSDTEVHSEEEYMEEKESGLLTNVYFTYPIAPNTGPIELGDEIPPEIYPRRPSLRDLEKLKYLPEEISCGPIEEKETEIVTSVLKELPTSSPSGSETLLEEEYMKEKESGLLTNVYFTYPITPDTGPIVLSDEIPPEIYPRRPSLRDLEELQVNHDMLQKNKRGTRDEKLDALGKKQPTERMPTISEPLESLLDNFSFIYATVDYRETCHEYSKIQGSIPKDCYGLYLKDKVPDAAKRVARASLGECSLFMNSFDVEDIEKSKC